MINTKRFLSFKFQLGIIINIFLICSAFTLQAEVQTKNNKTDYLGLPPGNGPVEVQASFHLHDINDVNDEDENFEFSGILTLTWKDTRQAFDPEVEMVNEKIYQGAFQFNELSPAWYPQVILKNESGLFEKHGTILKIKPDGTSTLIETINAVAEVDLSMRRHPFDTQTLEAIFEVFGFNNSEVLLKLSKESGVTSTDNLNISQWTFQEISANTGVSNVPLISAPTLASNFQLKIKLRRESFFMFRLVILPLATMVVLSWCVFWMDRSSLGDRINVSFVGILTAVAYQLVISDKLPHMSYITLINGFINISFLTMCSTIVINLIVGEYDKRGRQEIGDIIDRRCRKIYPVVYFGLLLIATLIAFTFF